MKRNFFLKLCLAGSSLILLSLSTLSKKRKFFSNPYKGFKVAAGEGRIHGHIKLKGVNANILDLKISGNDTNGGLAIFEQISLSQGKGTPLHVHNFQNEVFYVIEGNYFFKVGDDEFHLSNGDIIFLPQKIPHAWTQISKTGKMIVTFQPAGKMENFFVTVAALDYEPTKAEMARIFEDNEMSLLGPPLKIDD